MNELDKVTLSVFSDEHYMKQALEQAKLAFEQGEIPVGAVVVADKKIIARAHNQVEKLNDPTAHAEILAITAATDAIGGKYLNECTLYVTLEPCVMCGGANFWSQMGKLVFGASDKKRGYRNFGRGIIHPKTEVITGILADECQNLLNDFFHELRN